MSNTRIIITFALFFAPLYVSAEWYWLTIPEDPEIGDFTELTAIEYAVTQIPKDQLQPVDDLLFEVSDLAEDSDSCSSKYSLSAVTEELRKYDANNDFYEVVESVELNEAMQGHTYIVTSTTTNQSTIEGRERLIESIIIKATNCLEQEKSELKKKKREEQIAQALETCDTDFFQNEMTNEERMHTWDERQACKEIIDVGDKEITEPEAQTVTAPKPTMPEITPPRVAESVSAPDSIHNQKSTAVRSNNAVEQNNDLTNTAATSGEQQSDAETQESATREQPEDEVSTVEPENGPSFFRRVANFFRNLFSW